MTDNPPAPPLQKPKSLLETHRDGYALIQALNEFAASQKPSTPSDMPESSSQDQSQDKVPVAGSSADPYRRPKTKEKQTIKFPFARRKPVISEQPSVSKLLELGVKVRDFAYESTLPPVPTVYLQPRQIQPSVPKDVNDPNDPHYVLEEERKKKVYTFESTRKIERTPTEPLLESDMLPPPPRTFPKIKRSNAQFDLGSQFDSQPQSQPVPSHQTLPYDITNTPLSASQPLPGLITDSRQTEPWVDTPIVTPNGSLQFPKKPTATTSTASPSTATKQPSCSIPVKTSEMNPIATTDSQAPSALETMSYSRMGFTRPDSQKLGRESNAGAPQSRSHDHQSQEQSPSTSHEPPISTRPLTPIRVESPGPRARTPLVPTSPTEPSPTRGSPRASGTAPYARSHSPSPSAPIPGPSKLSPSSEPSSPSSSPRYNLRNKSKRRAESPLLTSPGVHPSSRPRLTRTRPASNGSSAVNRPTGVVSMKSTHMQDKTLPSVISTGRTMKRLKGSGAGISDADGGESINAAMEDTRRSKRRKKES